MISVRQEVLHYIEEMPDVQLEALRPILRLLVTNEPLIIETDLTGEEKTIIAAGREEFKANTQSFVPLEQL